MFSGGEEMTKRWVFIRQWRSGKEWMDKVGGTSRCGDRVVMGGDVRQRLEAIM